MNKINKTYILSLLGTVSGFILTTLAIGRTFMIDSVGLSCLLGYSATALCVYGGYNIALFGVYKK